MRCFAYSFSRAFRVNKLINSFMKQYKITKFDGAWHVRKIEDQISPEEGDIFLFPYGAIVTWGLTEVIEKQLCKELEKFLHEKLGSIDDDLYTYSYAESYMEKANICDDHIVLPSKDLHYKLACSYGLAQSVKLGGFENTIQDIFEKTRGLPEQMAKTGRIHLSRSAIRKLMGRIFVDRSSINLHLEFLDSPNFFWENTEFEPLYEKVIDYISQKQRVAILNQRLAVLQELLDMLATELNNQHSSMLEWIIIVLIAVEILLMIGKEIFHIF